MPALTLEAVLILAYTAFALFLSLYFVPFKVVPKAWAKAVSAVDKDGNPTHPAGKALDAVLTKASLKIAKEVRADPPNLKAFDEKADKLIGWANQVTPLINNLTGDNLVSVIKTAYSDVRKAEIARGDLPAGDLTENQRKELEDLRRDPDGKVQLVAAENAIDAAVGAKLLKESTGKALKKQLNAAFSSGQPIETILAPYQALLDRFLAGRAATPSVQLKTGPAGVPDFAR